jgi:hypothetical protein
MATQSHVCEGRFVKTSACSNNGVLSASFQIGDGFIIELRDQSFATESQAHEAALTAAQALIRGSSRDSGR